MSQEELNKLKDKILSEENRRKEIKYEEMKKDASYILDIINASNIL